MKKVSRRSFFSSSLGAAAALSLPVTTLAQGGSSISPSKSSPNGPEIIDTNINLLDWPFRKLKYGNTEALVSKLRRHHVTQAWAGNFEALFHKDINGVNIRLAQECRKAGDGMLLPFGTVNLAWPDWEEDLRRCHELHRMPGVRIYPIYQTFDLNHPDFSKLVSQATENGMIIQIVGDMEDIRHHHPIVEVREVNLTPLVDIMKAIPAARIQLLYWNHRVSGKLLEQLAKETHVYFDTSRVEGVGEVGHLIEGKSWGGSAGPSIPADRLLFGSHAPYFPVETSIIKLFESPMTLDQMTAIMNGNARRFLPSTRNK
ncbi:MAG TPA: amidohydrolase family protein [Chryseosolibacter sp.]